MTTLPQKIRPSAEQAYGWSLRYQHDKYRLWRDGMPQTEAEYIAEQACAWALAEAAKQEPEIPAEVKGRVQAEWFWKGVIAMKKLIIKEPQK